MNRILIAICIAFMGASAYAACPDGFEEIQMENITMSGVGASCASGQDEYYHINDMCTGNVY